jgi:SAM-dependent methyltransferase
MHDTALIAGASFAKLYGKAGNTVVDVGGQDVNGSLRKFFEDMGIKYICVDIVAHPSVDIVVKPGEKLPFETGSIDLIVSTSCFEHDPCFWMTFKEMCRIVKLGGFIYVNAPSNGIYHEYPGDNWRFYSDAGQALAYWSGYQVADEVVYPVKVCETFHVFPMRDIWTDFVCVWERVNDKETEITVPKDLLQSIGSLEKYLRDNHVRTNKRFANIHRYG